VAAVLAVQGQGQALGRQPLPFGLTPRELDVLRQIARGHTNKAMSERLGIAEKTAGRHIERLYAKIGVRSRAGATRFAIQHDLL
jgi:DNA-binding CsgD family transcriptional regulator